MPTVTLHRLTLESNITWQPTEPEGLLGQATEVQVRLPFQPKRFYRHGWHSWSLTTWLDAQRPFPAPAQRPLWPQSDDPVYLDRAPGLWSAWVAAVEGPDGEYVLLGALGLETRVRLEGNTLIGWSEGDATPWLLTVGQSPEALFATYARHLGVAFGQQGQTTPPRVWCSWYSVEQGISAPLLEQALAGLADLPFEVFQVDDGWQQAIGDWEPNDKFPAGMEALAQRIRQTGRTPGLWWAPFIVSPQSRLFAEHPDWLLRDAQGQLVPAGLNWNAPFFALDTTHPEVQTWLVETARKIRAWGYDYLKLDFLYAAALPGARHTPMGREAALRQALERLRAAFGEDAYLLLCGVPILPALGLADGLRIGPDTAPYWDNPFATAFGANYAAPGVQNALRTSLHRLWLRPLVHTDPDVAFFRTRFSLLQPHEKALMQAIAHVAGFRATSDLPFWLDPEERQALEAFWRHTPEVERLGPYRFRIDDREVDFSAAVPLPWVPGSL